MGAFSNVPEIIIPRSEEERLEWGWEPHEQVILKGRLSVADQKYTANKMGKINQKDGRFAVEVGTGRFALLERMILRWTFMNEEGRAVPVNALTIDELPSTYSTPILSVIDEITGGMKEEEQQDFLISANGHIVEGSSLVSPHLKIS